MKTNCYFLLLLSVILFSSCATPARRIRANPEAFAALTAEQQALVEEGRIALGFPPDAVRLALGSPQRVYLRQTEEGVSDIWSYVRTDSRTDRRSVRVSDAEGGRHNVWVDVDSHREIERLRVEFRDNKVVAVEVLRR